MADKQQTSLTVENTEDRIHCVADLHLRVSAAFKHAQGAPPPPVDALLPGLNEVDADEWAKAEKIPLVKHYMETGVFKVTRSAPELDKLSVTDAVGLVKRTVDRPLLERWFRVEKRRQVADALDSQLRAIEVPDPTKPQPG